MLELVAIGPGIKQRWRRRLVEGETVRLGRSPETGWSVPWDMRISREHADIQLDGDRVRVRCLGAARNSIYRRGEPVREFDVSKGEEFRIGHTIFRVDACDGRDSLADLEISGGTGGSVAQLAEKPLEDRLKALLSRLKREEDSSSEASSENDTSRSEEQRLRDEAQALRDEMEALRAALLLRGEDGTNSDQQDFDATADKQDGEPDEDTDSDGPLGDLDKTGNDVDPHEATHRKKGDTLRNPPKPKESRDSDHVILADFKEAMAAKARAESEEGATGDDLKHDKTVVGVPAPPPLPPRVGPKSESDSTPTDAPRVVAQPDVSPPSDSTPAIGRPVITSSKKPPTVADIPRHDLESELGLPATEIEDFDDTPPFTLGNLNGTAFGNYELLDQIFRGGSGQVLKAVHRQIGRMAAIKLLSAEKAANAEAVARFHLKARLLGNVQHPNIVAVYDSGQIDQTHYLIMEFADAVGVVDILRDQDRIDVSTAVHYLVQIAEALDAAHQFGIVHRNVHPGHLMVDRRGRIKLIGWGLAMHVRDHSTVEFERPGRILGLVDYISPEQIKDSQRVDARSDVYALGCTFFAILTKRVLYPVDWLQRKVAAQRFQPAPMIRELRPDVPEALEDILQKMLAKDRSERFRSMRDLVLALNDAGLVSRRSE